MMGRGVLCLALFSLLAGIYAQPPCALIMPSLLRVESEETIIVDAQAQNSPINADILIQEFPQKRLNIATAQVTLNKDNGFLGKVNIKIPGKFFLQSTKKEQYVSVSVKSDICNLEKLVMLSFHSGYIFIQTDKTIYNPGTTVLYRLFITGHYLEPDKRTVDLEFINPDNIVVVKTPFSSSDNSGIVQKSFTLPDIATDGIWTISAKFSEAPQESFRTQFEVKEYVLPSFEVLLECPQNYFFVNDNNFIVDITAKFLHGKSVEGSGHAIFGAIVNNEKKSFPESVTNIMVVDGKAQVTLERHMITGRYPDPTFLLGSSLYVSVVVTTNAGSDLVEAEKTDIPVVNTAFKMLFSKSSKYFKPGLPYIIKLSLQNPNGLPASNVKVCTINDECTTSSGDGVADIIMNTNADQQEMKVQVKTRAPGIPDNRQTTGVLTVIPYKTQGDSGNYLHISVPSRKVKSGDTLSVQFYIKNKNIDVQRSIGHITYVILSMGRVLQLGRQHRQPEQSLTVTSVIITEKFIPSFRIVAYYMVPSTKEMVSDSVWVDTENSCIRQLELAQDSRNAVAEPQPGSSFLLNIKGEPGASVGLVAVDKAVFVLNKKNRMSQEKIWKEVERSDLGCTAGGGMDNAGVFTDAGLSVLSNIGLANPTRKALRCEGPQRRKRFLKTTVKAEKAAQYADERLRRCCDDGMKENPMGYTCQRRSQYVLDAGECAQVFLECCKFIFEPQPVRRGRPKLEKLDVSTHFHRGSSIGSTGLSENVGYEDDYESMDNIQSRSIFYESWLWKLETLPMKTDSQGYSSKSINANFPESITTWELLGISISPKSGICVAKPYEILVKKKFFIDLRLPHSVVRNEQVEVRAVLYSYVEDPIEVRVDLIYNKKMCSSATSEGDFRQVVNLGPQATLVLPFVIVPLETGNIQIEVKASVKDFFFTDGVKKQLKVVPEGMRILKNIQSLILDPQRSEVPGVQTETIIHELPKDIVPNTDVETYVSVKGNILGETLENSIDGANLKHLITVPAGCGEQNMMGMTPTVIATHFLDTTGQWDKIGIERREEAIKNINQGYLQQLVYRKADHSYSAFTNRPPSTWLTAYVVKVFSMAYPLIYIDQAVLCGAVKWLISEKQVSNGAFREDAPVIHGEMVGGTGNTEPDASLTAFVLIALVESKSHCKESVPDLETSVDKSAAYLEGRIKTLRKPYSICITSYALSLVGKLQNSNQLMTISTDGTHWADESSDLYMIEATSYALLALLKLNNYVLAEPVTRWLTEQRFYGGGYGSTQATIMVFQAMSEYQMHVPNMKDIYMDVKLTLPGRRDDVTWQINTDNSILQRSEKIVFKDKVTVTAKGKGQGTLTIMSVYYAPLAEGVVPCKNFDFTVTLTEEPKAELSLTGRRGRFHMSLADTKRGSSQLNITTGVGRRRLHRTAVDIPREVLIHRTVSAGTISRKLFGSQVEADTVVPMPSASSANPEGNLKTMFMTICMKYLGAVDSTMTIVDITLLTGFTPDMEDLNRLTNRVDKYISKYEMDTSRSERGSLILYLDKVSRSETECLKFKIQQNFEVGILQPSTVTIYEYYALENRCTKFYHPTEEEGELKKICRETECHCISERCNLKNRHLGPLDAASRMIDACKPGVDYVYQGEVSKIEKTGAYDIYTITVTRVIKLGSDDIKKGDQREFYSHQSCRDAVDAKFNRKYIIWGQSEDIWEMRAEKAYVINDGTWFEAVPTDRECATTMAKFCEDIYEFAEQLSLLGCST